MIEVDFEDDLTGEDVTGVPPKSIGQELTALDHSSRIDMSKMPTRKERFGYPDVERVAKYYKEADRWAKTVMCPVCNTSMKLLKGRKGTWGENLLFQCHNMVAPGEYCLVVVNVTVGNNFYMRPGDFESCDFDWERIASETIHMNPGDEIIGDSIREVEEDIVPKEVPDCPWKRNVQSKVIWLKFWEMMISEKYVPEQKLTEAVLEERPEDRVGRGMIRLQREVRSLESWMTKKTGYSIKKVGGVFVVAGRGGGSYDEFPFSEKNYRVKHRMVEVD